MKQGTSTYSFWQYVQSGRLTTAQAIYKAAEMGFEGVEYVPSESDDVNEIKRAYKDVKCCGYCCGADFDQDIPVQVEKITRALDTAAELGSPVLRTDIYERNPRNPYDPKMLEAMRGLAQYAKSLNIALTTEDHGGYFALPSRLEKLFDAVGHDNFGLLFDVANFLDADADPLEAVRLLGSRVKHVHLKDAHLKRGDTLYPGEGWYVTWAGNYLRCAILGSGDAPMAQVLKSLTAQGYGGWLVHEFEGVEDCLFALSQGLNYAKRLCKLLPDLQWRE